MKFNVDWQGGLKFTATSRFGYDVVMDGSKKVGGSEEGLQPLEMMLFSLIGCTGMDVISITNKMKQDVKGFSVSVEAEQKEDHPRFITRAHVTYTFSGNDLQRDKLERAVQLSEEKYCVVGTTLSGITKITHTVKIEGEDS